MVNRILGEIRMYPWVDITIHTQAGSQSVRFIVDTGFDGELAVPRSLSSMFGDSQDKRPTEYADGQQDLASIASCTLDWVDGEREATVLCIGGSNPLIGMELLSDCLVTLEIEGIGGTITIEPNR